MTKKRIDSPLLAEMTDIPTLDSFFVGLVGFIGFPMYYFVWTYWYPQPYENLPFRLFIAGLSFFTLLRGYWPKRLQAYFHWYWYFSILIALPLFFVFMSFKNEFNLVWVSSANIAIFLVIMITPWLVALILIQAGAIGGYCCYLLSTQGKSLGFSVIGEALPLLAFSVGIGILLNYRHTQTAIHRERLRAYNAVISNLAHELRTPLQAIESGALGIENYLPDLISGYEASQKAALGTPVIPTVRYSIIKTGLQRIYQLAQQGNYIVGMAARNLTNPTIDDSLFETIDVAEAVNKALSSYPYNSRDRFDQIDTKDLASFDAKVSETLIIHIIYNLLQNAFYSLAHDHPDQDDLSAEKRITISVVKTNESALLLFKDTGTGIPDNIMPHIYERFYTTTQGGIGVGLPFVKQVMEAFGGSISCHSVYGEFCQFMLEFPLDLQTTQSAQKTPSRQEQE